MVRQESWFSKDTKNISRSHRPRTNKHTSQSSLVHPTPKFHQICLCSVTAEELIGVTLVYIWYLHRFRCITNVLSLHARAWCTNSAKFSTEQTGSQVCAEHENILVNFQNKTLTKSPSSTSSHPQNVKRQRQKHCTLQVTKAKPRAFLQKTPVNAS